MSTSTTRIAIVGAAGRMGTSLLLNGANRDDIHLVAAIVKPGEVDGDVIGPERTPVAEDLQLITEVDADVVIDFSTPASCIQAAQLCADAHIPFVSGTTGLDVAQLDILVDLSRRISLLHCANFSVGVNLLAHLVERAARGFGESVDIEIFEAHHRHKVDAPSGTAKLLGHAAAQGRGVELEDVARWSREGHTGPRGSQEIGFQTLRGGDIVGEHTAYFCVDGERLELTHRATDRGIFARGALRAARWLSTRSPGNYEMADVIFGRNH